MRRLNYLSLGSAPANEQCAAGGIDPDYYHRAHRECGVLIRQLLRLHGPPPDDHTAFTVKTCSHDFGDYLEVGVIFDSENEASATYAYRAEEKFPEIWGAAARSELGLDAEAHHAVG
jgi:hypothetical protein